MTAYTYVDTLTEQKEKELELEAKGFEEIGDGIWWNEEMDIEIRIRWE